MIKKIQWNKLMIQGFHLKAFEYQTDQRKFYNSLKQVDENIRNKSYKNFMSSLLEKFKVPVQSFLKSLVKDILNSRNRKRVSCTGEILKQIKLYLYQFVNYIMALIPYFILFLFFFLLSYLTFCRLFACYFIIYLIMQNKHYKNFSEEKQEEITVGVPINIPQPGNFQPYFQSNGQPSHPMGMPSQNQYINQNSSFTQMNQQPRVAMVRPQMVIPQPVPQQICNYSKPINTRCPCCSMNVTTVLNNEAGNAAYLWAGLICCLISPCCSCLPFLTDRCMDKNHYCPHCGFNILRKHKGLCDCS